MEKLKIDIVNTFYSNQAERLKKPMVQSCRPDDLRFPWGCIEILLLLLPTLCLIFHSLLLHLLLLIIRINGARSRVLRLIVVGMVAIPDDEVNGGWRWLHCTMLMVLRAAGSLISQQWGSTWDGPRYSLYETRSSTFSFYHVLPDILELFRVDGLNHEEHGPSF